MQITSLAVASHRIRLRDAFPVSYESHGGTEHVFVRLETDAGLVGDGEGTALPWFTGDVAEGLEAVVEQYLEPRVVGESVEDALETVREFTASFPGAPGASAAVEMALLDLRGKDLGVPVSALLGHRVRDSVPVTHVIPAVEPEVAAAQVESFGAEGFRSFKVKATGDVAGDVARIDAATAALPDDAVLRVDANTGWQRYGRAAEVVDSLAHPERLEYLEQPVATHRVDDMRRLWEETGIPVFADESFGDPRDVADHPDAVAGFHLKLAKSGSLTALREMQQAGQRRGMTVSVVSAFGSSLDGIANLHLAAVTPNLSAGAELCTGLLVDDPADPALPVSPEVTIPAAPGLGVSLDDALFADA